MIPRNAMPILEARKRGLRPAMPVLVSYVGSLNFENPTVYCDPGKKYDWTFLKGLEAIVFISKGCEPDFAGISDSGAHLSGFQWPAVVDREAKTAAWLIKGPDLLPMTQCNLEELAFTWN